MAKPYCILCGENPAMKGKEVCAMCAYWQGSPSQGELDAILGAAIRPFLFGPNKLRLSVGSVVGILDRLSKLLYAAETALNKEGENG